MNWKKKWQNELDAHMPEMSERVKSTQICVKSENSEQKPFKAGFIPFFAAALACVLALCLMLPSIIPAPSSGVNETLVLSINPSVAFTTDESGKVKSVTSLNADADVVLTSMDAAALKGKSASECVEIFVDNAIRLGFIDADAVSDIKLTGTNKKTVAEAAGKAQSYFKQKGVFCAVFSQTASITEIASLAGVELSGGNLGTLSYERMGKGVKDNDYVAAYEQLVGEDFAEVLSSAVENEIALALQKVEYVSRISVLCEQIKNHEDNPAILFSDYWTVVEKYSDALGNGEFAQLVDECTQLLQQARDELGLVISNEMELLVFSEVYNSESVEHNAESLRALMGVFEQFSGELKNTIASALSQIGGSVSFLTNTPEDIGEFAKDCKEFMDHRHDALVKKNEHKYNEQRSQISDEEYLAFINNYPAHKKNQTK